MKAFAAVMASIQVLAGFQMVSTVNVSTGISPIVGNTTIGNGYPQSLVALGAVDGRLYFVDMAVTRTWKGAKEYCEAANLKLASVETKAQADFLTGALQQFVPTKMFWTSLRESRQPSMLVWDGTDNHLDTSIFRGLKWDTPAFQYCILLYRSDNGIHLIADGGRGEYLRNVLCHF